MKIATYNLRVGGKKGNRVHWQQIFQKVEPDIFLVQECLHPSEYINFDVYPELEKKIVWQKTSTNAWGSAIYSKQGQIAPIYFESFPGWSVGAKVENFEHPLLGNYPLYIFSLHAPSRYYRANVKSMLNEIAEIVGNAFLIIGGDFNLTMGIRHISEPLQESEKELISRLRRDFGLINCWQAANPNQNLAQTLRWTKNPTTAYHCDALFIPISWYRYLEECVVLNSEEWERLSDHYPVVARFE